MTPRLLDLYCGQLGAGRGYQLAGFHVTGVDIRPMKHTPPGVDFIHADAIEYVLAHGHEYDVIHASPVCRAHSIATAGAPVRYRHEDQIPATRAALQQVGRPWIIENVVGAPLNDPVVLCGTMFRLRTYRHRLFETSFPLRPPRHDPHMAKAAKMGRPAGEGQYLSIAGNFSGLAAAREVMEMPWANQDGIRQAIPPAYTQWVGMYVMSEIAIGRAGLQKM